MRFILIKFEYFRSFWKKNRDEFIYVGNKATIFYISYSYNKNKKVLNTSMYEITIKLIGEHNLKI